MKKLISVLLVLVALVVMVPTPQASAQSGAEVLDIIYLEDGGYIVVEISTQSNITRSTVSKSKSYTLNNADGEAQWRATIIGFFTYDGRTASCTSSNCSVTIYNDAWYTISKTAWTDENYAKATVEMGRELLGVTTQRETVNLSLLCDRYGNIT